jgi:glycine betaine/proline transport system ATP-binding protein
MSPRGHPEGTRMAKVEIRNLSKIFGPEPERALRLLEQGVSNEEIFNRTGHAVGLSGVSFDVDDGEILVVMGLSGSGKSTLIRCINRLIEPTRGEIHIDGQSVTALDPDDLLEFRRNKFGMVFQNFALLPHRSIVANVEYGLEIQNTPPATRREKALAALQLVGLEGWEDAYPQQLSGGMQQRVGLARALAVDPEILLMDEAFSALDPLIRRDMQHELVSLQERMQKTILFISHDLDEAIKIGDRIVLMKDGAVVQAGTPEEILTRPATPYVERFVEDVDVTRVLTAASVLARARVVGYPSDGPRTALHKMADENYSSLLVVDRDYRLRGMVTVDDVETGLGQHRETLGEIMRSDFPSAGPDTALTDLFSVLSDFPWPVPVVDGQQRLLGVVSRAAVLAALANTAEAPATVPDGDRRPSPEAADA